MGNKRIYITKADIKKLRNLIAGVKMSGSKSRADLDALEKELNRAKLVDPKRIPEEVITMNSRVRLCDLVSGEELTYTIVYPSDANAEHNKISILAPIGTALLGYRVGDVVEWTVPSGVRSLKIQEVLYQPESVGDFEL
ncbi:MAG: nucleoside diphosphate kinase regulator [Syntrophales bacterium]|jgi:regulator of nucleoside diphosphate kinase|nr:nucleoside diphosphate kinase regulator [Syntrophales bacterium]